MKIEQEFIDVFCHWLPIEYYRKVKEVTTAPMHMLDRASTIPIMTNIQDRLAFMNQFPGYRQILSLVSPPIEFVADSSITPALAKIANENMAGLISKHPGHFLGFIASLPMNNLSALLRETEHAIHELKACGVQIFTNINGKPLDQKEFLPLFEMMEKFNLPIWLHPARGMNYPDYRTEQYSKYEIWWALGWLYETSVAMLRLVFAGIFSKFPKIKIIAHHAGAFIPAAEGRLGPGMEMMGNRTPKEFKYLIETKIKEKPLKVLKRFYTDTATFGSKSGIKNAIEFFGIDHVLFASDMPFGPDFGASNIFNTINAIKDIEISEEDRQKICSENIKELINHRKS